MGLMCSFMTRREREREREREGVTPPPVSIFLRTRAVSLVIIFHDFDIIFDQSDLH